MAAYSLMSAPEIQERPDETSAVEVAESLPVGDSQI
jgi:hypothetical protein